MKVELILIEGHAIGYNFVPEKSEEQGILKTIQRLHFLSDDRTKRISYDGISTDEKGKPNCMFFIQNKYAKLPQSNELKQLILKMSGKYIPQKNNSEVSE